MERLRRRLLKVIKDEFDRQGHSEIDSVQALLLYNIGDAEMTAGELRTRGCYLGRMPRTIQRNLGLLDHQCSRVDRRVVRIRGIAADELPHRTLFRF